MPTYFQVCEFQPSVLRAPDSMIMTSKCKWSNSKIIYAPVIRNWLLSISPKCASHPTPEACVSCCPLCASPAPLSTTGWALPAIGAVQWGCLCVLLRPSVPRHQGVACSWDRLFLKPVMFCHMDLTATLLRPSISPLISRTVNQLWGRILPSLTFEPISTQIHKARTNKRQKVLSVGHPFASAISHSAPCASWGQTWHFLLPPLGFAQIQAFLCFQTQHRSLLCSFK